MGEVRAEQFMRVLAPDVRDSLSEAQKEAIREAVRNGPWENHPIDLRFSVPTPFGRFFMTVVAGRERRSAARRAIERERHPLLGRGNLLLVALAMGIFAWIVFAP